MFKRIKGLFNTHCCEEFTQWENKEVVFSYIPSQSENLLAHVLQEKREYSKRWQERHCTICGKIQQRELRY